MSLTFSDICNDLKTFLESICRTCSRIDNGDGDLKFKQIFSCLEGFHSAFDKELLNYRTSDDLKEVFDDILLWKLNIKPNDGLPQQICSECLERFNGVKQFRNLCMDTQTLLQSYVNHVDTLLESGSFGRLSPKNGSPKGETGLSPTQLFNVDDLVEELPESPQRVLSQQNSPQLSPKYQQVQQQSPRQNIEAVYADSSLGTPPPLFDEINTEPIDMETMEYLKPESDLEGHNCNSGVTTVQSTDIFHPLNFVSSSSDSSEDDDDSDVSTVTDTEADVMSCAASYSRRARWQCKTCLAKFSKRSLLKEHRLCVHQQDKGFICSVCSKAFKSKFLLSQHKHKHNRLDSVKCEKCGKHFRSQLHMQRHHKNFHLTSNYTCHICNKKFENYTQMRFQYHVRQHGEKRFQCQYCEKSFHQKIHQINHERSHTGEQPFRCDVCGKCYRQQTACREHMLTHQDPTPFKCSICLKGFTQRSSLRTHLRGHSKDNNSNNKQSFNCELSKQKCTKESHLERHRINHRSHSNFDLNAQLLNINAQGFSHKVLHCKFCDKSFQKQQLLLLHIQQSHGVCMSNGGDLDSCLPFTPHLNSHVSPNRTCADNKNEDWMSLLNQ